MKQLLFFLSSLFLFSAFSVSEVEAQSGGDSLDVYVVEATSTRDTTAVTDTLNIQIKAVLPTINCNQVYLQYGTNVYILYDKTSSVYGVTSKFPISWPILPEGGSDMILYTDQGKALVVYELRE